MQRRRRRRKRRKRRRRRKRTELSELDSRLIERRVESTKVEAEDRRARSVPKPAGADCIDSDVLRLFLLRWLQRR
jgi:hypothetical protein